MTYKIIDSDNNETTLTISVKVTSKNIVSTGDPQKPNTSGGKLPQTGGTNSMFSVLIGGFTAVVGGLTFRKKRK